MEAILKAHSKALELIEDMLQKGILQMTSEREGLTYDDIANKAIVKEPEERKNG